MGSYMTKGEVAYTSLDYQNALEMYNNEIHKNPKSHLAFLLKGNCLYKLNRQEEAIKSFDKTLELQPDCIGAIYNKGFVEYTSNKNYKQALKLFSTAISKIESIDKNNQKFYYLYYSKGLCEYQLEQYDLALNSFLKAKELKKNDFLILDNIGRCYDKLKDYVKAIEFFINSFLASNSKYYIALYNQGMSLLKIKKKQFEAKKIFESITDDYNADFGPAYYGLGLYFVYINEKKIALDYFEKAIALDPDLLDAYLRKGNCFHRLKRYTESIDCFDFVISRDPGYLNGIAFFNKGNSLKEIKRIDDAIECYQNAIKYQKKEDGDYYYNLGLCQYLSRKINSALENIEKSIQIKETWKNFYLKGIILKKNKKDYLEVINIFNKSIEINEDFCDNYYNKAILFFNNKRNEEALTNIKLAIEKYDPKKKNSLENNDKSNFYYLQGSIYRRMKNLDEALKSFDEAINLKNNYSECFYEKGAIYLDQKNYEKCLELEDEAIKCDSQNHYAYFKKGECLMIMKNYKEALKYFESALSINAKSGKYFYYKGKCLYELKRKNDAMYSFDKAIRIGTQNLIESYYYKGLSLYDLQILKESKISLLSSLKLIFKEYIPKKEITENSQIDEEFGDNNLVKKVYSNKKYLELISDAFYYLGLIDFNEKKYTDCLTHLSICIQYNKNNDLAYYNKGLCYSSLKLEEEAMESYKQCIKINPKNDLGHFKLGNLYFSKKQKEDAIKHYTEAYAANSNNYYAVYNMGRCYQDLKKYDNALNWYNESIKIEKHYYPSLHSKARVLFELQRYEESIEAFIKSIHLNKNDSTGYYYIGYCYYMLKNNEEAKKFLDESIKVDKDKENYKSRYLKAKILEKEKKTKEAIKLLKEALSINDRYYEAQTLLDKLED